MANVTFSSVKAVSFAFLFTLVLFQPSTSYGAILSTDDAIESILERARLLFSEMEDEKALEAYQSILEHDPEHFEALWHVVILHTSIGFRQSSSRDQEAHYEQAYDLAGEFIELYPDSAGTHFVYAAAAGRKAQSSGARERVRMSTEIRKHAEKAVELDPEYSRAWNVLGNWHHRAANLSRLERFAANALFGGAPEGASNDAARDSFARAIEIDPHVILYYHDKADFYLTIGEEEEARRIILKGLELESIASDDELWKSNMREMLDDL
ncbi:hypothetical protein QLX67_08900 [Balneolaceae bacterium ANBcel3]|nr:hypothetical protein [Balneolaceae bacterium ANBcel3]